MFLYLKKIQLQATNGFPSSTKYGLDNTSTNSTTNKTTSSSNGGGGVNYTSNKYVSLSNGTLTNGGNHHHNNNNNNMTTSSTTATSTGGPTTTGVTASSNPTSILMRSLLNQQTFANSSKQPRNYFNHLNGGVQIGPMLQTPQQTLSMTSNGGGVGVGGGAGGSTTNVFTNGDASDQSTFSILPSEAFNSLKHHHHNNHHSHHLNGSTTASTTSNQLASNHQRLSREKTGGPIMSLDRNGNSNSRELLAKQIISQGINQ
jgi:hypothetical protein